MHGASQEPDRDEFDELVAAHQEAVWRYLRFLGAEPEQARDLLQETFFAVWQKPFEKRSDAATRRYLSTVARNKFLMERRRGRVQLCANSIEEADLAWERYRHDGGNAYLDALRHCLQLLPPKSREALEMRYASSASRTVIAEKLGLGLEGVKSLMRRIRTNLRDCVEKKLQT